MPTRHSKIKVDIIEVSGFPSSWTIQKKFIVLLKQFRKQRLISSKPIALSIAGVSKSEIQKWNRKYRKKNSPTDVLSFEQPPGASPPGIRFLGDILLCLPIVKAQAKQCKHTVSTECAILLAHALLHLLGYDHERSKKEDEEMAHLEERILSGYFSRKKAFSGLIHRTRSME